MFRIPIGMVKPPGFGLDPFWRLFRKPGSRTSPFAAVALEECCHNSRDAAAIAPAGVVLAAAWMPVQPVLSVVAMTVVGAGVGIVRLPARTGTARFNRLLLQQVIVFEGG